MVDSLVPIVWSSILEESEMEETEEEKEWGWTMLFGHNEYNNNESLLRPQLLAKKANSPLTFKLA